LIDVHQHANGYPSAITVVEGKRRFVESADYSPVWRQDHTDSPIRTRLSGPGGEQERQRNAHYLRLTSIAALGGRPLSAQRKTTSTLLFATNNSISSSWTWMRHQALHQGIGIWNGLQRPGLRAGRCDGFGRRYSDQEALAAIVLLREEFPDIKIVTSM